MSSEASNMTFAEFLSSDMVLLATQNSDRKFRIHKALFESKLRLFRLEYFKEGEENLYRFEDTTDGTLVRFIEWAYRGEYPDEIPDSSLTGALKRFISASKSIETKKEDDDTEDEMTNATKEQPEDDISNTDPLLNHMQMYIFAHVYRIEPLEALAFDQVTAYLAGIAIPQEINQQLVVISVLELAFSKIDRNDILLDWLANYAAYCVAELKLQPDFHQLLEDMPFLSSAMIRYLSPATEAPWKREPRKFPLPYYTSRPYLN